MAKNMMMTYYDTAHKDARKLDVPTADFDAACNLGVNTGIGVTTGIFDFNEDNFSKYAQYDYVDSQYIGQNSGTAVAIKADQSVGGSYQFVKAADADVPPGGAFETGLINMTGETVPAGSRAFGFRA
jgi:hypothetical protein